MSATIPPAEQPTTVLPETAQFADGVPEQTGEPAAAQSYQPVPVRPARPTTLAEMNAFALIAIVLAFVQPLAGIVFGHMGLSQIKRNGDAGRGVALTALIIGYVTVAGLAIVVLTYFAFIIIMFATMGAAFSEFDPSDFDNSF